MSTEDGAVEENATLKQGQTRRDELMAAIVERRRSEIADTAAGDGPVRESSLVGDLPIRKDGDKWLTRVKVNGEEFDVPFDEVVTRYQKDNAADRRLAEVANRQKQLDQYAARLEQREKDLLARATAPQTRAPVPRPGAGGPSSLDARKLTEALYSGDEDAATTAFEALLAQTRQTSFAAQPMVDENALAANVLRRLEEENKRQRQMEFERKRQDALVRFKDEYRDVMEDQYLRDMADRETLTVLKSNPTMDPWEILKVSGDKVREWLGARVPVDRGTKKRLAASNVGAARARADLSPEDTSPKSASDVIAEMRKARGQM
jgi:hypothetical protein